VSKFVQLATYAAIMDGERWRASQSNRLAAKEQWVVGIEGVRWITGHPVIRASQVRR
jgi:hypothetical protein